MFRRRRDAALPAPRGRYGQPGPRRPRSSPRAHPPSAPGSAPTSPLLSAALFPPWPAAPSLPQCLRNPGHFSARLGSPARPARRSRGSGAVLGRGRGGAGAGDGEDDRAGSGDLRSPGTGDRDRGWMGGGRGRAGPPGVA